MDDAWFGARSGDCIDELHNKDDVNTARFVKYVWSFFKFMHKRIMFSALILLCFQPKQLLENLVLELTLPSYEKLW